MPSGNSVYTMRKKNPVGKYRRKHLTEQESGSRPQRGNQSYGEDHDRPETAPEKHIQDAGKRTCREQSLLENQPEGLCRQAVIMILYIIVELRIILKAENGTPEKNQSKKKDKYAPGRCKNEPARSIKPRCPPAPDGS